MRYAAVMRRARLPASPVAAGVLAAVVLAASASAASPTTVTAEGGGEADTNVQRVETGPGFETARQAAAVARFGARVDHRGKLGSGALALSASVLTRIVGPTPNASAQTENVALFATDVRWVRPVGDRPIAVGAGVVAVDAMPLSDDVGARTFRNLGADALLVLRGGDERTLTLAVGGRRFEYKPEHAFDWIGPAVNARLDLTLWQPAAGTRSLELAATVGFEARAYESTARANACGEDEPPTDMCFARTTIGRRDRYQRAALELVYVGSVVATGGYQLSVIDSNSYGQSLARHRGTVSVTTNLPYKLVGTVLATLQLDQYLDGLIVQKDLQHQEFTNLDDANRSSLQLRVARAVSPSWSLEARAAIWRNLGESLDTSYRRELVYLGAVYSR